MSIATLLDRLIRPLIMCSCAFFSRAYLKWNRNRLCCAAIVAVATDAQRANLVSPLRTIYFYFSFTGTITENFSLFLCGRCRWVRVELKSSVSISICTDNYMHFVCNTNDPEKTHVDKSWIFLLLPAVVWLQCATSNILRSKIIIYKIMIKTAKQRKKKLKDNVALCSNWQAGTSYDVHWNCLSGAAFRFKVLFFFLVFCFGRISFLRCILHIVSKIIKIMVRQMQIFRADSQRQNRK